MNAQEIIEYIRTAPKKTPVKVYVWEDTPVDFPNCQVFPAAPGHKIVFGDWADVAPVLEQNHFRHLEIENNCHNSAIPLLDIKNIPARIEPGAIIREQVEIGKNAVIMMGAILNIGAVVGEGTMIDMGAVLGGRATVGKHCHIGAGTVLAGVVEPPRRLWWKTMCSSVPTPWSLRAAASVTMPWWPPVPWSLVMWSRTPWWPDAPPGSSSTRTARPPVKRH